MPNKNTHLPREKLTFFLLSSPLIPFLTLPIFHSRLGGVPGARDGPLDPDPLQRREPAQAPLGKVGQGVDAADHPLHQGSVWPADGLDSARGHEAGPSGNIQDGDPV